MKVRKSRVLPAAAAAALILAACGSDDPQTADDGPVSSVDAGDAADDAADDGDDGGLRAPTPIEIVRGSGGSDGLAAEAATDAAAGDAATSGAATSDMIAPIPWIAEYVVADAMPALPTDDVGYVFDGSATASADQVEVLARALGVEGDAVRDDRSGITWRVGPGDGSPPNVFVHDDAQLSWNYNGAWDAGIARAGCAVSIDSEGNESEECELPEPPVGVPAEAEAEQLARDLLVALGEEPSALQFETYGDEWFASVRVSSLPEGGRNARFWNFGFGAEGALQFAGGVLATPERVGPYPLVDLDTAVARISDSMFGGFGGVGGGIAESAVAVAESPPVDIAEGDVEIVVDDEETMPVEPMPVEPMPDPEPVVVTLVDVEADLWWAWDVDGSVWLLPAYRFIDADGGWYTVPAVTDEFMIQVDPPIIDEPLPLEPLPAPEPLPVEPEPAPDEPIESLPPDEGVIDAPEPIEVEPDPGDPDAAIVELNGLLPLKLEEFIPEAELYGFSTRVVVLDGEGMAVTDDFSATRVNVEVKGDTVVAVRSVG